MLTNHQLKNLSRRYFGLPPRFDPEKGETIFEPEGKGYGYWVGGHSVVHDAEEKKYYLFYRIRHPLGKGRGCKCIIADSTDGVKFSKIWEATKEQLDAESIEVGSLIQDPLTGKWRLYISYARGGIWRVDLIEADHPRNFDAWHHRTVMQPENYGLRNIKDPRAYIVGGLYVVFAAVSPRERFSEDKVGVRHPLGVNATAMLTSADGIHFRNLKYVFEPGEGLVGEWGHFSARINSIVYLPPVYVSFFDGGSSSYDTYEEQCGVAFSHDLEHWTRVSTNGPWVQSPYGCIRYLDAITVGDEIWYYYEYTRQDGSHELRVNKVNI